MKKIKITILLAFSFVSSYSQQFNLPELSDLLQSVEEYYGELTMSQKQENQQMNKMRWLNYIPSPSYHPFAGGFGLSVNIAAPLQELTIKHEKKQKNAAIEKLNKLQSKDLKNQITYEHQTIKISIEEYFQHTIIDSLKAKSFNLYKKLYSKNDVTPSEFLSIQQNFEIYKLQRKSEENSIKKAILQLLINAKKAAVESSDFTKTKN
jgi:hypothetical protein